MKRKSEIESGETATAIAQEAKKVSITRVAETSLIQPQKQQQIPEQPDNTIQGIAVAEDEAVAVGISTAATVAATGTATAVAADPQSIMPHTADAMAATPPTVMETVGMPCNSCTKGVTTNIVSNNTTAMNTSPCTLSEDGGGSSSLREDSIPAKLLSLNERKQRIAESVATILECLGEDINREGLAKTPMRYAGALVSLTQGYTMTASQVMGDAEFDENHHEIVLLRDIDIYSLCEHHMVPFFGKCHIAYIPNGKVIGLSKLAKVADMFSQRLQVQERLTSQIAQAIESEISPKGVAVYMEAQHMCMVMRGVKKSNASTITTCMLGCFKTDRDMRSEFLSLIR